MKAVPGNGSAGNRSDPGYRILAIDPGTRFMGYAVLRLKRAIPRPEVLAHGAIAASGDLPLSQRLKRMFKALLRLLAAVRPHVVVVEEVFYGKNFQSALKIGEGRAIVLLAAALSGCEVVEYPPATIKQAVTGNGRASKPQVERVISRLLALSTPPSSPDASDALAIAFCHAQRLRGGLLRGAAGDGAHSGVKKRRRTNTLQKLANQLKKSSDSRLNQGETR